MPDAFDHSPPSPDGGHNAASEMPDEPPERDMKVLLTAEEAFPEMERAFLAAQSEIWAGFRVFDLRTKLRSEEAKTVGDTWGDLIVHLLRRGVRMNFVLSDFDPITQPRLHCMSWRSLREFQAARDRADAGDRLTIEIAAHSARVGLLPRLVLWPRLVKELGVIADDLNDDAPDSRAERLKNSPRLDALLKTGRDGKVTPRWWPVPPLIPGTHHQKIVVFDREHLCIGGLDVDERRYDDKGHHRSRDETWHDVQVMCRGPVVAEAQKHIETFLSVVAGKAKPAPCEHLLQTLTSRRRLQFPFLSPRPQVHSLADAHHAQIREARRLIYLETQFFRDRGVANALAEAGRSNPDLTLILVIPGAPEDVAFYGETGSDARFGEYLQAKCIETLRDGFEDRLAVCAPAKRQSTEATGRDTLHGAPIIYVHAKVSIFDDRRAIVSSANLNGRSLYWDTEAGVMLESPDQVATLRRRVFDHWLSKECGDECHGLGTAAASWRNLAARNADLRPEERSGFLLPYDSGPAERFGRPLPGVPDAMV